jgi:hypothetical protein
LEAPVSVKSRAEIGVGGGSRLGYGRFGILLDHRHTIVFGSLYFQAFGVAKSKADVRSPTAPLRRDVAFNQVGVA